MSDLVGNPEGRRPVFSEQGSYFLSLEVDFIEKQEEICMWLTEQMGGRPKGLLNGSATRDPNNFFPGIAPN